MCTGQWNGHGAGQVEWLLSSDSLCPGLSFLDWKTPNRIEMLPRAALSANCLASFEERVEGRHKCLGPGFEFRGFPLPAA